jgi:hypothetical protein
MLLVRSVDGVNLLTSLTELYIAAFFRAKHVIRQERRASLEKGGRRSPALLFFKYRTGIDGRNKSARSMRSYVTITVARHYARQKDEKVVLSTLLPSLYLPRRSTHAKLISLSRCRLIHRLSVVPFLTVRLR